MCGRAARSHISSRSELRRTPRAVGSHEGVRWEFLRERLQREDMEIARRSPEERRSHFPQNWPRRSKYPSLPPAAKGPSISGLRGLTVAFATFSPLISMVRRTGVSFRAENNFGLCTLAPRYA